MIIPNKFNKLGISSGKDLPAGCIAYISCLSYKQTALTGQQLSFLNVTSSNFITYAGIKAFDCSDTTYRAIRVNITDTSVLPLSFSLWFFNTNNTGGYQRGVALGQYIANGLLVSPNNVQRSNTINAGGHSNDWNTGVQFLANRWNHVVITYSSDKEYKQYLNGNLIYSKSNCNINPPYRHMSLGMPYNNHTLSKYTGYISHVRQYNRVLTQQDVLKLYSLLTPMYLITATDPQTLSFYQKNETIGISYSSAITPTFLIVSGSLPSSITFNTSTGQFTGKGLTDADHTYQLRVRMYGDNLIEKTITVNINTYKTARINFSNQTHTFITESSESKQLSYTSDLTVTFTPLSSLPTGITISSSGQLVSSGNQTSGGTYSVSVKATSLHNTDGVTATVYITISLNKIIVEDKEFVFNPRVSSSKTIKYTSTKTITPIYSYSGSLPSSITFNSATGTFTCNGTQTTSETTTITVTVSSSTGLSDPGTGTYIINIISTIPPISTSGLVFYAPLSASANADEYGHTMVNTGMQFGTYADRLSAFFNNTYYGSVPSTDRINVTSFDNIPVGNQPITLSVNCYMLDNRDWRYGFGFGPDNNTGKNNFGIDFINNCVDLRINGNVISETTFLINNWYNYVLTYDGNSIVKLYVDGLLQYAISRSFSTQCGRMCFGANPNQYYYQGFKGYICRARIYNRVLSSTEIIALANEFTLQVAGVIRISGATGTALGQSMAGVKYDDYDLTVLNGDYELLSGTHGTKTAVYKNSNNILIKYAEGPGRWLIGRLLDDWQQDFVYMGASFQVSPVASDYTKNAYSGFFTFSGATDPLSVTLI